MPIKQSYARMKDGVWSGGTYVCWGTDNRESPIRLCNANSPSARNFEFRCLDGTANPYIALAAVLGVGHAGIRDKAPLAISDCAGGPSAALMGEERRTALGITDRMPLSWEEARGRLRDDTLVNAVLGKDMITKYLSVHEVRLDSPFIMDSDSCRRRPSPRLLLLAAKMRARLLLSWFRLFECRHT
jgi:glutamine synthetase